MRKKLEIGRTVQEHMKDTMKEFGWATIGESNRMVMGLALIVHHIEGEGRIETAVDELIWKTNDVETEEALELFYVSGCNFDGLNIDTDPKDSDSIYSNDEELKKFMVTAVHQASKWIEDVHIDINSFLIENNRGDWLTESELMAINWLLNKPKHMPQGSISNPTVDILKEMHS